MPDLNFAELRQDIESSTDIPEFSEVRRRARRHKRWRVLMNAARVLGVLVIATPALAIGDVVISHIYTPETPKTQAIGVDHNTSTNRGISGLIAPITRTVVAVTGIDLAHAYALVDVCQGVACNLQLSQVNPNSASALTDRYGLLRVISTDVVSDPQLVIENDSTVVASAVVGSAPRQYVALSVNPIAGMAPSMIRPIQTNVQGPIRVVKGLSSTATTLANQPPVSAPVLESTTGGWWVTGTTPNGQLAVSVSHDNGHSWTTVPVGVAPDSTTPSGYAGAQLATSDGVDVYLLIRTRGKMSLLHSGDGGATWGTRAAAQLWPSGSSYGLVMTKAGALIAWFSSKHATNSLTSTDQGISFQPMTGTTAPSGPVVAVGSGFVTLGANPSISSDGVIWQAAYVPYASTNN